MVKSHTFIGQFVQVWSGITTAPICANGLVAQIIGHDKNYIRFFDGNLVFAILARYDQKSGDYKNKIKLQAKHSWFLGMELDPFALIFSENVG
tara:strand:+ start:1494 stop:1772 length:279 start_codon:yes stop_codon:yes gene_type:complete